MRRCLVTGAMGFVGMHLLQRLGTSSADMEVVALGRTAGRARGGVPNLPNVRHESLDMLDRAGLETLIDRLKPDWIFHLASHSSVSQSWVDPIGSFVNNTNILLNLLEAVRTRHPAARVLSVGSSEEYGRVAESELPLREQTELHPTSPYAVARVSQEQLSRLYCEAFGLHIVMTRSFNHIGPGQRTAFAVPSFLAQLLALRERPTSERVLRVGDVSVVRDFTDVRDVVQAYVLLLERGASGEAYNICSGRGVSLQQVIDEACGVLGIEVRVERDTARLRPLENTKLVGSYAKLATATGWAPRIALSQSLRDMLAHLERGVA